MWTAGSVWIASFEGTRWRPYGDGTDVRYAGWGCGWRGRTGVRRSGAGKTPPRAASGGQQSLWNDVFRRAKTRRVGVREHTGDSTSGGLDQEESRRSFPNATVSSDAVSRSRRSIGPPHCGHGQAAWQAFATTGAGTSAVASNWRQSANDAVRWRLARKPKLRMRTKRC